MATIGRRDGWAHPQILLRGALVAAMLLVSVAASARGAPEGYHLIRKIMLPSVTGWDYLHIDGRKRQLYVSNNSGVIVINIDTLRKVGTVPSPPRWPGVGLVHGVATANKLGYGYISRELPPSVVTFGLGDLRIVRSTRVAAGPDAIIYDPKTDRVFSFDGKNDGVHHVSVVDARTGRRIAEIRLPGRPEYAVSDHAGHIFVNIASLSKLARINARTLRISRLWRMGGCRHASALTIDRTRHRLFAACDNDEMVMMSARSGRVIGAVHTGGGTDAVRFDPNTRDVLASNGSGTLTVAREVNANRLVLVQQVKTARGARTMALDPKTGRVFLMTARFGPPPQHRSKYNPHGYPRALAGTAHLLVYAP